MVVVVVSLGACPPVVRVVPDAGPQCVDETDCGTDGLFFCDYTVSRCVPRCATRTDCDRSGELAIEECAGPLGCQCDQGRCVTALCSADAECGAQVCRNGACVTPPAPEVVSRCSITPDVAVLRPGAHVVFSVLAWGSDGEPVVVPGTWTSLGGALTGEGTGTSVELTAGAPTGPQLEPAVEVSFGAVRCQARALVVPGPMEGTLALAVVDAHSGRPISGAKVLLSDSGGNAGELTETDLSGFARVTSSSGPMTVSIFHPDFTYLTYANVAPTVRELSVALERNPFDRYGGVSMSVTSIPATGEMHFGRVGLSTAGDLLALDPTTAPRKVPLELNLGGRVVTAQTSTETLLDVGTISKTRASALGQAGGCSGDGACGARSAWGLFGSTPSLELAFATEDQVDRLVGGFPADLTWLSSMGSSVVRDVEFPLVPPTRTDAGVLDLSSESSFEALPMPFRQLPLAFEFTGTQRGLLSSDGENFGLGGALVPGRGFVPLGVGLNGNRGDQLLYRLAPAHHGLEGARYVLLAEHRLDGNAEQGRTGVTALLQRSAWTFGEVLEFSAPPLVATGTFDPATRVFTGTPLRAVSALRVRFTDGLDTRWDVLVDASAPSFTLPLPPGALRDRLFLRGNAQQGVRARETLEVLRAPGQDFTAFITRTGTAADLLLAQLDGFSFHEVRPVALRFLDLTDPLPHGSTLALGVEGVRIGTDAVVKLSFSGGTGCPQPTTLRNTVSTGRLELVLPLTCLGPAVTMEARLLTLTGAELVPPVSTSVTVALE